MPMRNYGSIVDPQAELEAAAMRAKQRKEEQRNSSSRWSSVVPLVWSVAVLLAVFALASSIPNAAPSAGSSSVEQLAASPVSSTELRSTVTHGTTAPASSAPHLSGTHEVPVHFTSGRSPVGHSNGASLAQSMAATEARIARLKSTGTVRADGPKVEQRAEALPHADHTLAEQAFPANHTLALAAAFPANTTLAADAIPTTNTLANTTTLAEHAFPTNITLAADAIPTTNTLANTTTLAEQAEQVFPTLAAETASVSIAFSSKEYTPMADFLKGYSFVDPVLMVEPMRMTAFKIEVATSGLALSSCEWSVRLDEGAGGGVFDDIPGVPKASKWSPVGTLYPFNATWKIGNATSTAILQADVRFPSPGTYLAKATCSFEAKDGMVTSTVTASEQVKSYYIRRELRELNPADLQLFLNTFMVMYKTPTDMGIKLYGRHYRSLTDFGVMHLRAASSIMGDKMHDGMGLVTQHSAMTSEFELALQSVQPTLACPYWDYTIDSVRVRYEYGHDPMKIFTESYLFSDEVFGRTDLVEHHVTSGRMSNVTVPRDFNFSVHSPHGFLRAPWNINPSSRVTRFHKVCGSRVTDSFLTGTGDQGNALQWPTCSMHYATSFDNQYEAWYDWVWHVGYAPHGPVHAWIGGIGGDCDTFSEMVDEGLLGEYDVALLKHLLFAILKNAYREKIVSMPEFCAQDASVEHCMWKCSEMSFTTKKRYSAVLSIANITDSHPHFEKIVKKVFCDTPYWPGDHLEAASPIEASFWPIHPTLDRLVQYKDIVKPFKNVTWNFDSTSDKSYCIYSATSDCKGHHAGDLTFYKSVYRRDDGSYAKKHATNEELLRGTLPRSGHYSQSYLYSHFSWSHCMFENITFPSVDSVPALS